MPCTMNKATQTALFRVFQRGVLYPELDARRIPLKRATSHPAYLGQPTLTFREFRRYALHSSAGCWMVPWCGMWLGIEPDGYTHS